MKKTDFSQPVKSFLKESEAFLMPSFTVDEALSAIRATKTDEKIIYFYVLDENKKLKGVVSTRNLLLSDPSTRIEEIMQHSVVTVFDNQTLQEAMSVLISHHLLAIPVIDHEHRLLGIIDVRLYLEEHVKVNSFREKEDVFQMLGFVLEEGKQKKVLPNYAQRMPWILCNMLGGIGCAIISRFYQGVLEQAIILAMFIPLVLSLSESISMQTMTQSFLFLRKHNVQWKEVFLRVMVESKVVALLAISSAILVGALSLLWEEGTTPAIVICLGILLSVSISGCIGSVVPFVLHARKLDPKVAAGPLVLSLADIVTTLIYFTIAANLICRCA